jgi:hypothetical protein
MTLKILNKKGKKKTLKNQYTESSVVITLTPNPGTGAFD